MKEVAMENEETLGKPRDIKKLSWKSLRILRDISLVPPVGNILKGGILNPEMVTLYNKILISILLIIFLMIGCTNKSIKMPRLDKDEYLESFFSALSSNDEKIICLTIDYINSIIMVNGEKTINSIYYDKARLLYKLGRFDEAVESLCQSKRKSLYNDLIKATLYVRIGRNEEAFSILTLMISEYKRLLSDKSINHQDRNNYIHFLLNTVLLLDYDLNNFLSELLNEELIQKDDFFLIERNNLITKELLLKSMWPD
jgi:tetratricopeptide (TPR) repeat protein